MSGQQDIAHFSTFWIPQDSVQLAWDPFAVAAATGANVTTSNSTTRTSNSHQNQNSTTTTHPLAMELLLLRHTPLSLTTSRRHRHHAQEWQQLLHYQVQQSHLAIRNWFWERYGGEYGRSLLTHSIRLIHQCHPQQHAQQQPQEQQTKQQPTTSKGFHNALDSLVHALRRQLMVATTAYQDKNNNNQKKNDQKPSTTWHVVVLGNGAAAGYGNYRYQAYSQQLQRVLNQILNKAVLQLLLHVSSSSSSSFSQLKQPQHPTIQVTNLALDQSTEFPTTWCLSSSLWLAIQQQQKDNNHNRNPTRTSNNSPYSPLHYNVRNCCATFCVEDGKPIGVEVLTCYDDSEEEEDDDENNNQKLRYEKPNVEEVVKENLQRMTSSEVYTLFHELPQEHPWFNDVMDAFLALEASMEEDDHP